MGAHSLRRASRRSTGPTASRISTSSRPFQLRLRPELPGDQLLSSRSGRNDGGGSPRPDKDEPRRGPSLDVRLHRVQLDRAGRIDRPGAVSSRANGSSAGTRSLPSAFDDRMKIRNASPRGKETVGALLIKNSWGVEWGEGIRMAPVRVRARGPRRRLVVAPQERMDRYGEFKI